MNIITLPVGQLSANCYLVYENINHAVIIDPGDDADFIMNEVGRHNLVIEKVFATHGHFDHIMAAGEICLITGLPLCIHGDDVFLVQQMSSSVKYFLGKNMDIIKPDKLEFWPDSGAVTVGDMKFDITPVPGHTPGSVVISSRNHLFCGDLVFADGTFGRTDFSYSDSQLFLESLKKLKSFPAGCQIYPGHDKSFKMPEIIPWLPDRAQSK